MKKLLTIIFFLSSFTPSFSQYLSDLSFGNDSTFEIITWNLEWFPTNGQSTIDSVITIIEAIDVDVIAVQEINNEELFAEMLDSLEGYSGHYKVSDYLEVGYIYKTATVQVDSIYEIFTTDTYFRPFPRNPMVMEFSFMGVDMVVINSHLKCCGDGTLDLSDIWDEETRRYDACNLLNTFVELFYPDEKVFLVGDFNDLLEEDITNNVFEVFIEDTLNYKIVDMDIAEGPTGYWSYPTWPSHLDHIIITNELMEDYEDDNSTVETLLIENNMVGGFNTYENYISDHRAVAMRIPANLIYLDVETMPSRPLIFTLYPNPADNEINIVYEGENAIEELRVYNYSGQCVIYQVESMNRINISSLIPGIYIVEIRTRDENIRNKIIVR